MSKTLHGVSALATVTVYNAKIADAENKILDTCDLVMETDYNCEISDIEENYFWYFWL